MIASPVFALVFIRKRTLAGLIYPVGIAVIQVPCQEPSRAQEQALAGS